jgi:hypothetical protein
MASRHEKIGKAYGEGEGVIGDGEEEDRQRKGK